MPPSISVCLPVCNAGKFLKETLQCILGQTLRDIEVVCVLNGSTDDSETIAEDFAKNEPRLRLIKFPNPLGTGGAYNMGMMEAKASYVANWDADDLANPERLEKQYERLCLHPEIDLLGTQFHYIDEHGNFLRRSIRKPLEHEQIKKDFRTYCALANTSLVYRRDKAIQMGGFKTLHGGEDFEFLLHALAEGMILANLPDDLVAYRIHTKQFSTIHRHLVKQDKVFSYREHGPKIWPDGGPQFTSSGRWKRPPLWHWWKEYLNSKRGRK